MVHGLGKGVQLGRVQRTVIKTIPKKKKCKKAKWLSEEALQIAEKGREAKGNHRMSGHQWALRYWHQLCKEGILHREKDDLRIL